MIATLLQNGLVKRFVPRSRRKAQRRLYLTANAEAELTGQYSAIGLLSLRGEIEVAMTHWTLGELVYADDDGNPKFLKRLEGPPPEIWNIRVTESDVQARLFCRFLEPNALIVTKIVPRSDLSQGGKYSAKKWNKAMNDCLNDWNALGLTEPYSGETIRDYVWEKCDDFPI